MTKLQRIVAILEGWLDYFPQPETWSGGLVRRSASPGQGPSRVIVCAGCEGRGKLPGNWPCGTCNGTGKSTVDTYTGEPVATAETSWASLLDTWTVCSSCAGGDRQCGRCNGTGREAALLSGKVRADLNGKPQVRQGDSILDALADGVKRRQATETGRKIDTAMGELHAADPFAHSLIVWVYVLQGQPLRSLHPWARVRLVQGMLQLEQLVVGSVVLPPELAHACRARAAMAAVAAGRKVERRARETRDAGIRRLWADGTWSQDALGRKFGVDQATVSRVVRQRAEEAA